ENGDAWNYFTHEQARARAYRWGEDGIGGISDYRQRLCFSWAFWNGVDPILKQRLFGLTNSQGNHGEDVKEVYWYLDNTPTHSFMRMVYRYPQAAYPYAELLQENKARSRLEPEFELWDTNALQDRRYFDIELSYAKAAVDDVCIRASVENCGPVEASLTVLPTLFFRNTWSWDFDSIKPSIQLESDGVVASHRELGSYRLRGDPVRWLFSENETNAQKLFGGQNSSLYMKDSFERYLVEGEHDAVNPSSTGTMVSGVYQLRLGPGEKREILLRLSKGGEAKPETQFVFKQRESEANEFYNSLPGKPCAPEYLTIQRQAFAGLLWNKQFYYYVVERWLQGDPAQPSPPAARLNGRNSNWRHLYNERVMSMPDTWEYPWYASWDLAFHCLTLALVDPHFAKGQLDAIAREWFQSPKGEFPAYEWRFGDVNPPVIAWAAWRIYKIEQRSQGKGDRRFLETLFHKLLINFTWWVNRKDSEGKNIFQGGFLGLDNIGVFDRSATLPDGARLEQSDGTSWMGLFCLNMMRIALELARYNPVYENIATKFFEHFLNIAAAMNNLGGRGIGLWHEEDGFYYDVLHFSDGNPFPLRVRSLVGLMPLLAVETIEPELLAAMPGFAQRLEWYLQHRPDLTGLISRWHEPGAGDRRLIALTRGHRMKCLLRRMLDPAEFLSDFGVRSLSKFHLDHPYSVNFAGATNTVSYEPGESQTGLFGGNSNWRGPVWFPINYLLIESLQKFHHYYGDDFKVESPTGSGRFQSLCEIADDLSKRLISLFLPDGKGQRPCLGASVGAFDAQRDGDRCWFHEYFHGDTGAGLGASHQTGWTALVAKLIQQQGSFGGLSSCGPKKPE
ncbi:MAG: glucosidase, partial [Verrucomicrobiota bacterium]